jgi:hypothetical protein
VADDLVARLAESKRIADTLAFACRDPNRKPDFTFCGGPAAEDYWEHFTPARVLPLVAAVERVLELHQPQPIYGLADNGNGKPLCAHSMDYDGDAHFEGDDGYWYCRDKKEGARCSSCADEENADIWAEWPCPTFLAITTSLSGTDGKEGGDGLETRT